MATNSRWTKEDVERIQHRQKTVYYVGIDCGVKTGLAVWNAVTKQFTKIETLTIHRAMETVKYFVVLGAFIRVEDARKRKWFGKNADAKQQGAGSVKRDCKIWEDFLTDIRADFEMVAPKKGMTKHSADAFNKITGYNGLTSEHARDAAILVWNL